MKKTSPFAIVVGVAIVLAVGASSPAAIMPTHACTSEGRTERSAARPNVGTICSSTARSPWASA